MTPAFKRKNQCTLLLMPEISLIAFNYAAITLFGVPFQETSFQLSGLCSGPTTFPSPRGKGFGLSYAGFARC